MNSAAHTRALILGRRQLAAAVQGRRRLRLRRTPAQVEPKNVVRAYTGRLFGMVDSMRALADEVLRPQLLQLVTDAAREHVRTDSSAEDARKLMERLRIRVEGGPFSPNAAQAAAREAAQRTADAQKEALERQLRVTLGVEVPIYDQALGPLIQNFTAANVSLITSISQQSLQQVEVTLLNGLSKGARADELADEIGRRFDVSESRASLIARDQVNRFYGNLNRVRQQGAGVQFFFWETDNDERTCDVCGPLQGQRFSWEDPPAVGVPGEAHPGCRCSASPDVESLLESLEGE